MAKYFVSGLMTAAGTPRYGTFADRRLFDLYIEFGLILSESLYRQFKIKVAEKLNANVDNLEITNITVLFTT